MRIAGKYMWMEIGEQLVVPVRTDDGWVLVNVGWVPLDESALIVARERGEPAPRRYSGLMRAAVEPDARGDFPFEDGFQRRWRSADVAAMGAQLGEGARVAPLILVEGEGLPADAPIPDRQPPIGGWRTTPPERPHGQYAFTWFSLAFTLVGVWASMSLQRAPEPRGVDPSAPL